MLVRKFSLPLTAELNETTNLGLDLIPSGEGITDTKFKLQHLSVLRILDAQIFGNINCKIPVTVKRQNDLKKNMFLHLIIYNVLDLVNAA